MSIIIEMENFELSYGIPRRDRRLHQPQARRSREDSHSEDGNVVHRFYDERQKNVVRGWIDAAMIAWRLTSGMKEVDKSSDSPLKVGCLRYPSAVTSRYSTSAIRGGSTQRAFGFFGPVSCDFGVSIASRLRRRSAETFIENPVPALPT